MRPMAVRSRVVEHLSQQQADNRCRLRAHGEANADFRRPLRRGVCHHSIETKNREQQRDGAKEADECRHHPLPAERSIENIAEQLRTLEGKLAVDLPTASRIAGTRAIGLPAARTCNVTPDS